MRTTRDRRVLASIAANTRRVRERRGLTQEQLAEEADLDVRQVQRVERGTIDFGVTRLVRLASALDIDVGKLLRLAKKSRRAPGSVPNASTRRTK